MLTKNLKILISLGNLYLCLMGSWLVLDFTILSCIIIWYCVHTLEYVNVLLESNAFRHCKTVECSIRRVHYNYCGNADCCIRVFLLNPLSHTIVTLVLPIHHSQVSISVPGYMCSEDLHVWCLLVPTKLQHCQKLWTLKSATHAHP